MAISKVLVANRGEIAVRAFRAAYELGARTVAVYAFEDRNSEHRLKADEAYEIGERGRPVQAYLDVAAIVDAALRSGADAVYPGYGFLSESADLAAACAAAGITFVGPSPTLLTLAGSKTHAIEAARAAGIPTLRSTGGLAEPAALIERSDEVGFPLFVKAVAGGGGRGMRRVEHLDDLAAAIEVCQREAAGAFGDPTVFLEQAVDAARHIEVQVLGDATGEVVHLFERDCSVQRRHQKVVEIAPAPNLAPALRERLCADAVRFARHIGYRNAGTVEFLVGRDGSHVFIEMNPRIQVEHTVTEEITDVDLVQAQLRIAGGATLSDLGLSQATITTRGAALQCRVTTEDAAAGFRPSTGMITAYRTPGGAGVRVDSGSAYPGAEVTDHFDSLLAKLTCRADSFEAAVRRARRALAEFRVRGVPTNLAFLAAVLDDDDFIAGNLTTGFIDDHPDLLTTRAAGDRATRLVQLLADVTVNRPHGDAPAAPAPSTKLPPLPAEPGPPGTRQRLLADGPLAFTQRLRSQTALAVTDTTFRDAHQSLLATRVRTTDLVEGARGVAALLPGLWSIEAWGGATYDVALRFLGEDPWARLDAIRQAAPKLCVQMLLRGRNTVGYTPYPDAVTRAFVTEAAASGIDVFRIFDALNDVDQMVPAIEAVLATGTAVAQVALCYTGDLSDPRETKFTLDHYLRIAERAVAAGAHMLCIKDMAGLLRPEAATRLVTALRERFDVPLALHTHDTAGGQLATLLAGVAAGVDSVDCAASPMSGTTSQPPLSGLLAATEHTARATGIDLTAACSLEPYWDAVRSLYAPFESGLRSPTGRVYRHEIPGGQLSNLRQQARALGIAERFEQVEELYAAADAMLGRIVKVTPSSKVVGDLALHLVGLGADPAEFVRHPDRFDVPGSLLAMLHGELGEPEGGWPEPFRSRAIDGRPYTPPQAVLAEADAAALAESPRPTLNRLLFPGPTQEWEAFQQAYGDVSVVPTREYLYGLQPDVDHVIDIEVGKRLYLRLAAIGEPDERGLRTVVCTVNGQQRQVTVRDRKSGADPDPSVKADPAQPGQVGAPYQGIVTVTVAVGDEVAAGAVVATIEAMKIEGSITSPVTGVVRRVEFDRPRRADVGDLIVIVG